MGILGILFQLAEFLAALIGLIYISKYRTIKIVRYFVYFLCLNFLVEIVGNLPYLMIHWDRLSFLKNTFLVENFWLYNVHILTSCCFYVYFFYNYLTQRVFKTVILTLLLFYFLTSVSNLIFSDVFLKTLSSYTMIFGVLLILLSVFFYFFEMLKSEKILYFGKDIAFYIAIGTVVLHLIATPLIIYGKYYKKDNYDFIEIRTLILYSAIIFTYTCYSIGFILCSDSKQVLQKNR